MTSTAIVGHQTLVSHVLFALRARLTSCFTCQWLVIITREKLDFAGFSLLKRGMTRKGIY